MFGSNKGERKNEQISTFSTFGYCYPIRLIGLVSKITVFLFYKIRAVNKGKKTIFELKISVFLEFSPHNGLGFYFFFWICFRFVCL